MAFKTNLFASLLAGTPILAQAETNKIQAPGREKSTKTEILEAGAKLLQNNAPVASMDIYLTGFHPMKEHPDQQMEAHHFCRQLNEDVAQCALFDGNTKTAHLNGIEYIISEKLFRELPQAEKKYWHPHNYEILSGQLQAPGLPALAEKELMRKKLNSYGKTWHFWNTGGGGEGGAAADKLPMGETMLAWSFNHDGEIKPGLVEALESKLKISTLEKRKQRRDLAPLARPQEGVDALSKK